MSARLACRVGRHRWISDDGSTVTCRDCGAVGRKGKTLLCRIGFHSWVAVVNEGARFLECRRCGGYGGEPGSFYYIRDQNRGGV